MQRLTGMDATFLYMETPTAPMHVAGTYVYDPSTTPGFDYDTIRDEIERRLHLLPPYRRRLVEIPFQLHHPLWIEDPDFDLDYHLHRIAVPAPGGQKELNELAADIHSRPLDRTRPLWEFWIVEGLEDGHVAVVAKTHHCAIDGASGVDITVNLLDLEPEPQEIAPPEKPWAPDRIPSDPELVGWALSSLARQPISAIKAVRRTVEAGLNIRSRNRKPDAKAPPAPFSAPRTSINEAITARRTFGTADISLDDIKTIRKGLGGTVNDVILALCAGTLRNYFDRQGEEPEKALVAMCPISIRTEDQKDTMGNQVSSMLVSLATDIDDPVERLRTISAGTGNAKDQAGAIGADTLANWAEFAAPAVAARAARLYSRMKVANRHRPIFNVTISNVPGPQVPIYMNGAKLVRWYPMGPIADGSGLNITVMSYLGTVHFGLVACADTVHDVQSIADGIHDALKDLLVAAESA
ncbi:MAG TPA: wax ester/triacylglycerol synthase family O-acyltransferase [Acidimicrobiales bacterium]|nr:wax ester/triacylglycerol synthase family O-acyltransferase [Acidimicrobiales bacterium]